MKRLLLAFSLMLTSSWLTAQCTANWIFDDTDLTIQFTDLSTSAAGDPIVSWFWDFDDGNTSNEQNPLHTFVTPDKYSVELTITTQSGCTAILKIDIEICEFNIAVGQGACNANNEVPLTITVLYLYDNAKEIDITVDGNLVPGGPFPIDLATPVTVTYNVPGDGLAHTIDVQSTDIPTCNEGIEVTVDDCGTNCFLSALTVALTPGVTHTVIVGPGGNNVFSPVSTTIVISDLVQFSWQDNGHSSTSDATSGPDSWNSGVIGIGSIFNVTLQNPGVHNYYCIPHGGPGGVGMSGNIVANCPGGNNFTVDITFNTTQANPGGYNVLIDNSIQPGSPHSYNGTGSQSVTATLSGDGQVHEIKIEDVDDPTCFVTTNFTAPDCGAAPTCSLSITAVENGPCTANDDVPVDVTVTAINPGNQGFNIKVDGVLTPGSPYTYSPSGPTTVTVDVAGDGQPHDIQALDVVGPTCNVTTTLTTTNCTIPCALTNLTASTGSSATHVVTVNDNFFEPKHVIITSGDVVEWQWVGAISHSSTSDATSGPNSWDSGVIGPGSTFASPVLDAGVHPYYCIPHGAPGGVGMSGTVTVQANCTNGEVSVTVSFDEAGGGFNGFRVLVDGTPVDTITYDTSGTNSVNINVAGDGQSHTILVEDVDDPACNASTTIVTPNCNAPTCQLTVVAEESGPCTANDDVPVDVTVTAVGGGNQGFNIKVDGVLTPGSPYTYAASGPTTVTVDVAGDGQPHDIQAIDVASPTCNATTTLTTTNCTIPCSLTNLTASTGSSATHVVTVNDNFFEPKHVVITSGDVVEWQWVGAISHSSTSDATSGPNSWDSGVIGPGSTFASPVLDAGVHPYYCIPHGAPGGVGMSGTVTVQANCTNGEVSVTVSFDEAGGGFNGFRVLVDGTPVDTITYDTSGTNSVNINVAGDGQSHTILVEDVDDPACSASTTIVTPNCNFTPTCEMTLTVAESGCNAADSVDVELSVAAINGGSSFNLLIDGNAYGGNPVVYDSSGTTLVNLTFSGDSSSHVFIVQDAADSLCADTASVILPNCAAPCSMSNLTLSTGGTGNPVTHVIEVKDFEFVPKDITVTAGDVVHWEWVGVIAHTTTSDATSGPLTWDSGLFNNGATFDVTISETGFHPYYCIPHGAPGGIGMSGTIVANPPCDSGQVAVTLSFDASNGGALGYNVKVDGNIVAGSPFNYSASGTNTVTVQVSGDGNSHTITVIDTEDLACTISGTLTTPNCGGGNGNNNCELSVAATQTGDCDSQNQIPVELTITHSYTGSSGFNVKVGPNLVPGSPFGYDTSGVTVLTIPVTGTGQSRTIIVEDVDSMTCTAQTQILTPLCGPICEVQNITVVASGKKHTVEVKDFEFVPANLDIVLGDTVEFIWMGANTHTTTSDTTSVPNSWNSGLLNNGDTFQVVISEAGDHPYYSIPDGGPGGIGMSGVIHVLDTCDNGIAALNVSFEVSNGSPLGYRVFVDGEEVPGGPFQYGDPTGANNVVIQTPGDGMPHLVTVQDLDINFCAATTSFTTPECPVLCLIENLSAVTGSAVVHNIEVKDFEFVPNDLTVRTGETVHFFWTGAIPHSTTSDALSGPDSWDSGIHGAGFVYDISLTNTGDHQYYCIPHGGPGGIGQSGVIHAVDDCENGLVQVAVNFSVTSGSAGGYNVFVDGEPYPGGPFAYDDPTGQNLLFLQIAGDGIIHTITVQDTETSFCAATTQITLPDCNAGCEITGLSVEFPAPVTHTVEVKDFEFVPKNLMINLGDTIEFQWTGAIAHTTTSDATSGSDSWDSGLFGNGATWTLVLENAGLHPYYCIPHGGPGGIGMAGTILVKNNGCQDGQITADLSFQSSNTGTGYNLYVDDVLQVGSPFEYNSSDSTTTLATQLPGDGGSHTVIVADADDAACADTLAVPVPNCDSNCSIGLVVNQEGDCDAGGQVPFAVTVESSNAGSSFHLEIDGNPWPGSPFNYDPSGVTAVSISLPGDDGVHTVEVVDADSASCGDFIDITTADCSNDCSLSILLAQTGSCDSSGEVPYDLSVEIANAGTGFDLIVDGVLQPGSPFDYTGPTTVLAVGLTGDGQPHVLIVSDSGDMSCADTLAVQVPDCGVACVLKNLQIDIDVPIVHTVEVLDFEFFPKDIIIATGDTVRFVWTGVVPHTSTSDATAGADTWNSGLFGQGSVYDVVVETPGFHPYYCIPHGGPGGIGMSGTITAMGGCDDNLLPVQFSFEEANGSFTGYNFYLDSILVPGSPFAYGAGGTNTLVLDIPAEGQTIAVLVEDADAAGCTLTGIFTMPNCDDPCFGYAAAWEVDIDHPNLTAQCSNTSTVTATSFLWLFGDGETSALENPAHTYASAGTYDMCLILENSNSLCADTLCQTISVGEYVCEANFSFETNGLSVQLTDQSTTSEQVTEWTWDMGNSISISGQTSPAYTYDSLGIYTICLSITAGQCQDDTCVVLDLSEPCLLLQPEFAFTVNHEALSVQFLDLTTGGPNQWLWGFGDGITSNDQSPGHFYDQPGFYNVCLLVQNTGLGCNATYCEVIPIGVTDTRDVETRNPGLIIYPNPSPANNFVWTMEGVLEKDYGRLLGLRLFDVRGGIWLDTKVIGNEHVVFSSSESLAAGIYFLELRSEEGRFYRGKIVVQ